MYVNDFDEPDFTFADDACLLVSGATAEECTEKMQERLGKYTHGVINGGCPSTGKNVWHYFSSKGAGNRQPESEAAGITVEDRDCVTSVRPDSLADKKGIQVGMWLRAIQGEKTTAEARKELQGQGTEARRVALTLETPPRLHLDGVTLEWVTETKYLGVIFDSGLTFGAHLERVLSKYAIRLRVIQALSGTSWGCSTATMQRTYTGYVMSAVLYGCSVWWPHLHPNKRKLLELQHRRALRTIIGCVPRTRNEVLYQEARSMTLAEQVDVL
eukprot:gene3125-3795_t